MYRVYYVTFVLNNRVIVTQCNNKLLIPTKLKREAVGHIHCVPRKWQVVKSKIFLPPCTNILQRATGS